MTQLSEAQTNTPANTVPMDSNIVAIIIATSEYFARLSSSSFSFSFGIDVFAFDSL